jgi:hypothetical protein
MWLTFSLPNICGLCLCRLFNVGKLWPALFYFPVCNLFKCTIMLFLQVMVSFSPVGPWGCATVGELYSSACDCTDQFWNGSLCHVVYVWRMRIFTTLLHVYLSAASCSQLTVSMAVSSDLVYKRLCIFCRVYQLVFCRCQVLHIGDPLECDLSAYVKRYLSIAGVCWLRSLHDMPRMRLRPLLKSSLV